MKIAIVAEPYVPIPPMQYGGIEQIVHHLIRGLTEAGHEPILLAPGDSQVDCELIPICKEALYFPKHRNGVKKHEALVKKAQAKARRELRQMLPNIDIIHSHGFDLWPFRDFPTITTLHNPLSLDNLAYYQKRKDQSYVSISKNQQEAFPDLDYVGVIYNGEDPKQFPIVHNPGDYLCFLGRFDRDKNPHIAIQLALNAGIKIKLAGKVDYHDEGYFDAEIKPYLKHPLVEYLGEVGFAEKVELISNAQCNLHPTNFREPFGLTVIEAAYCGTPTLAIDRGSLSELIEQDRSGILVEDFVEGRHKLEACIGLDRTYVSSRARQLFNYRSMTQQYIDAYEKIIVKIAAQKALVAVK